MRRLILEEPVSRAAVWSGRTAVFALATAGVAIALSRFGGVDPAAALTVFGAALVLAFLAVLLAGAAGGVIWRTGRTGADKAAIGFALSLALLAEPAYLMVVALRLPAVNDVSTDLESPPPFMISPKARLSRGPAGAGRSRSGSGLSARLAYRQGSRLAHRRRQPAQSARRWRRPD